MEKVKENIIEENESSVNIFTVIREWLRPEQDEEDQEETILNDNEISDQDKKLLMKALKTAEGIVKPTSGALSHRKNNLKLNYKKPDENALKKNPIEMDAKTVNNKTKKTNNREIVD